MGLSFFMLCHFDLTSKPLTMAQTKYYLELVSENDYTYL
ncbi:hypothetical protein J2S00_001566 [Caldalkalibacillus uzonensis]|uniref:Uncharacterized protein n=1 Tax=Caldalkalibacillus uzonensis TaxID=353224 RepID=A0ABU0CQU7_9BACI|nr:hypothetical protein [Caldalkalibacillus uzonensis]